MADACAVHSDRTTPFLADVSAAAPRARIALSLSAVYLLGGSNYAAIAFALDGFEPFTMLALRFLTAGAVLGILTTLWVETGGRTRRIYADVVLGLLLLGGTFGGIALAQTRIDSGLVAVVLATAPVWATAVGFPFGERPVWREWLGFALCLSGITALLGIGAETPDPVGLAFALLAALSLAAGSAMTRRLPPAPPIGAAAIQMISAGLAFVAAAIWAGEAFPVPVPVGPTVAIAHQSLLCSVVAFTAFVFLLGATRSSVATSFVYVNPMIALALGAFLLGESVAPVAFIAIGCTLIGVLLIVSTADTEKRP